MTRPVRSGLAVALLIASALALFFGSHAIPACLGPLGGTLVGCYAATGAVPATNTAAGALFAACLLGAFIALVWPSRLVRRAIAAAGAMAIVGAVVGVAVYERVRPLTLEGYTMLDVLGDGMPSGPYVVIPIPFELDAALASALLGAAVGLLIVVLLVSLYRVSRSHPTSSAVTRQSTSS